MTAKAIPILGMSTWTASTIPSLAVHNDVKIHRINGLHKTLPARKECRALLRKGRVNLWPMETTNQDTFHQYVSIHPFHHIALCSVRAKG